LILGGLSDEVTVPLPVPALLTARRKVRRTTVSVVLALAPVPSVAVIVVVPALRPVASPVASIVATVVLLLTHVPPAPPVPIIVIGPDGLVLVPSPNWPSLFQPQHFTVLSERSAQVWKPPVLTATAVLIPPTRTGVDKHLTEEPSGFKGSGQDRVPRAGSPSCP
jgi:hypothetical protein